MDERWAERFPALFGGRFEEYANADLTFHLGMPDDDLLSRLHLVALDPAGHVVVCRSVEGWRFLPGGTREPDESLAELATRELMEETGYALTGPVEVFAFQAAHSHNPAPYRAHLPFPDSAWAYAVVRAEPQGAPLNPPDGETVVEVAALPTAEAAAWLREHDFEHADVVLLAEALGLLG